MGIGGGLLRKRDFRLFWIGETVNQLGSAMALIGVPLLAVLYLHAGTFEVGALAAAAYLPWLVIGLPAGAWVDRLPPRPLMIACDLASAALYASVPISYVVGVLTIGQLLVVQLLAGAFAGVFGTAYQVNLPSLVTPGELAEANAKLQAGSSASSLGGRGLSGVVAQVVGATAALVFNAASFLVSAACLLAIRAPERRPATPRQASSLRREVAEGMAFVFRDPYLRPLTLFAGLANFALDAFAALVVVFLVRVVGLDAGWTGALTALPGLGGLLAAFIARPIIARIGSSRGLLLATIGALPFALLIPLAERGPRLALFAAGILIAGAGVTMSNIVIATFRQSYCPPDLLGRVTATMRFVTVGTSPFGALAGGAAGTWLGARDALWFVLSVLAGSGTLLLSRNFTRRRDLPASAARPGARNLRPGVPASVHRHGRQAG
jgi:MFS family permease